MGCQDTSEGEEAANTLGAPMNVNPIQLDITNDASIEHCFRAIEQLFGKLDILISSIGVDSTGLPEESLGGLEGSTANREAWSYVFNMNCISNGVLTERMIPLLEVSGGSSKIIFISSTSGSLQLALKAGEKGSQVLTLYSASMAAINMLAVQYALRFPKFSVNACCSPTPTTTVEALPEVKDMEAEAAVNAVRLATQGAEKQTGTFTNVNGPVPW